MNCEKCRIGQYHPTSLPYMSIWKGQAVVLPNALAHVCDVCRYTIYEPTIILRLQSLLDHEAEEMIHSERRPSTLPEESPHWQPTRGNG